MEKENDGERGVGTSVNTTNTYKASEYSKLVVVGRSGKNVQAALNKLTYFNIMEDINQLEKQDPQLAATIKHAQLCCQTGYR